MYSHHTGHIVLGLAFPARSQVYNFMYSHHTGHIVLGLAFPARSQVYNFILDLRLQY